jgi:hypothetical protein
LLQFKSRSQFILLSTRYSVHPSHHTFVFSFISSHHSDYLFFLSIPFIPSMYLSIPYILPITAFICFSIPFIYPFICTSPSVYMHLYISFRLSIPLPKVPQFVHASFYPLAYLFIHPSLYLCDFLSPRQSFFLPLTPSIRIFIPSTILLSTCKVQCTYFSLFNYFLWRHCHLFWWNVFVFFFTPNKITLRSCMYHIEFLSRRTKIQWR